LCFQNIAENRLGRDGADAICEMLYKNESLKSLNMSGNMYFKSIYDLINLRIASWPRVVKPRKGQAFVSVSKKFYTYRLVLVGSRNGFEIVSISL
jgi:hypothetical protein